MNKKYLIIAAIIGIIITIIIVIVILLLNKKKNNITPIILEEKPSKKKDKKPSEKTEEKQDVKPVEKQNCIVGNWTSCINQQQYRKIIQPASNGGLKCSILNRMCNNYNLSNEILIRDQEYYRLGTKNLKNVDHIINVIDSIIASIKDTNILNNLLKENTIFLIGNSAREFSEFDIFKDTKTVEGSRNLLDVDGYGPNKPLPGYLSIKYNLCPEIDEDILVHEFLHVIHLIGFTTELKTEILNLYQKYKKLNDVKDYGFINEFEFFAEFGQLFLNATVRLDNTNNITRNIMMNNMVDLWNFYLKIFDINKIQNVYDKICENNCSGNLLCNKKCEDLNSSCNSWFLAGECEKNPNYMLLNCKKSCNVCN